MADWQELLAAARNTALNAFVPYSNFRVGAAVLSPDGRIFAGCNIENASYGLTNCAERAALFTATAAGARNCQRIAISCIDAGPVESTGKGSHMPCGSCRQVMHELMGPDAEVMIDGIGVWKVRDLLPLAFELPRDR